MVGMKTNSRCAFLLFTISSCFVLLFVSGSDILDDKEPVIATSKATFRGRRFQVGAKQVPGFERTVDVYSRIPYAEPPVGDLRYARPVPTSIEGDFDATRDPIACAQLKNPTFVVDLPFSEDCLVLDVTIPQPQPENAPVMVWIHGGAYYVGAGRMTNKDTLFFAARGNVILVTINYRLGMLGFMTTGDNALPANLGLLDQRQALLWVQENIAAFGGDPSRVTIFGESAGSGSVNMHLLSTMSAGLFSGAIMQSGALTMWTHHPDTQTVIDMTRAFGTDLGCNGTTSEELVTCLRGKSIEEMEKAQFENSVMEAPRYTFLPTPDGEFLLKDPFELAAEGSFNPADIMIGCLSEEGNINMPFFFPEEGREGKPVIKEEAYRDLMTSYMQMSDPMLQDIAAIVMGSDEMFSSPELDYVDVIANYVGGGTFACPTVTLADQMVQAGRNVFLYWMTHQPSHSFLGKAFTGLGATHGEDLAYVFGLPFLLEKEDPEDYYMVGRFAEEEVAISLQMMKYWSNFGKTGDPNLLSPNEESKSKFSVWPKYTSVEPRYKEISKAFESKTGKPNAKRCHFLQNVLPQLTENAAEMERLKSLLEESVQKDSDKTCEDSESCP